MMEQLAADPVLRAWQILESVDDPEIPGISIVDLGIVRFVRNDRALLTVGLSPTYSGCPATDVIAHDVRAALHRSGFDQLRIEKVLSPPWSSDDLTQRAKTKLSELGIAPPQYSTTHPLALHGPRDGVPCPRCGATRTLLSSEFGSTPCKALYRCEACLEPFEAFKCF
jgi:ring-1,2-phenylacetyl-CoA epoxidase subunit PaaD